MSAAVCPQCGGILTTDFFKLCAPECNEFDGCVGWAEEYCFAATPLTCPLCGGKLICTGTLWEDANGLRSNLKCEGSD